MEPNIEAMSKKVLSIVRVAIFMIRKGLCKKKIITDLNMMMKRGKFVGKALKNLMFHHHNNHFSATPHSVGGPPKHSEDIPINRHNVTKKRKIIPRHRKNSTQFYTPLPYFMQDDEQIDLEEVHNMVEMVLRYDEVRAKQSLGFERSPMVRQLRITDSPFPLQNSEDSKQVDQAADAYIKRFYSKLNQQNYC